MRAKRVDGNQAAVVAELRALGCFVEPRLSQVGSGCPDLLVGYRGRWLVVELKDPEKPPSGQKLTEDERRWQDRLDGRAPYVVATTTEEIFEALLIK